MDNQLLPADTSVHWHGIRLRNDADAVPGVTQDHGGMGSAPFGDAGDVSDPHRLVNGRIPAARVTFPAKPGQRVRMRVRLGKDTVLIRRMESIPIEVHADNTGDWMIHCHNIYHAEAGMMIVLSYAA